MISWVEVSSFEIKGCQSVYGLKRLYVNKSYGVGELLREQCTLLYIHPCLYTPHRGLSVNEFSPFFQTLYSNHNIIHEGHLFNQLATISSINASIQIDYSLVCPLYHIRLQSTKEMIYCKHSYKSKFSSIRSNSMLICLNTIHIHVLTSIEIV